MSGEADLALLPLAPVSAEPPHIAVCFAVPCVAGAGRCQGLPEPEGRIQPVRGPGAPGGDEHGFGVLVTLLLVADCLHRVLGSARVPVFLSGGQVKNLRAG